MTERRVPKRNIEGVLVDVKGPRGGHRKALEKPALVLAHRAYLKASPSDAKRKKRHARMWAFFGALGVVLAVLFIAAFVLGSRALKGMLAARGAAVAENFSRSVEALQALDAGAAARHLAENEKALDELAGFLEKSGAEAFLSAVGGAVPAVGEAAALLKDVVYMNANLLDLSVSLEALQNGGVRLFMSDGPAFLAALEKVRGALRSVMESAQRIKNATGRLKSLVSDFGAVDSFVGERYLAWSGELHTLGDFLGELTALLSSPTDRHILLMFQNPSEIRPGGGFLGSYGDLTVRDGTMQKLDVRDIYDPDGQLADAYRSPEAFGDWTEWKARDANWFFDFPTSAEAVLSLLEASKMYENYGVKFDAAIAVNIEVIEALLATTGPVELPEYDLTITEENFLREVQREVEQSADKAAGKPKRILQTLAPALLERLGNMEGERTRDFLERLGKHYDRRDLMFYARESKLERFIREAGGDGGIYALPGGFWGNYLAVVNANIDGKKSDAVVAEKVVAFVDVATDGSSLTDLSITRTHRGDLARELFWRATNRNYMQIYAPPSSELVLMKGNDPAPKGTELTERDIEQLYPAEKIIEKTKRFLSGFQVWSMEAFGKRVFATWMNVAAGKSRTLELRYQTPGRTGLTPKVGDVYTFVYERQSGVPMKLSLAIAAPIGFTWKETETPRFTYEVDDIPGRLVIPLTLAK